MLDLKGIFPKGIEYGNPLTKKLINKYIEKVCENLEVITYVKVEPNVLKITNYFLDGATAEDKSRKYTFYDKEDSYYYKDKNNKKEYLTYSRIWDERVEWSSFYVND